MDQEMTGGDTFGFFWRNKMHCAACHLQTEFTTEAHPAVSHINLNFCENASKLLSSITKIDAC
jgi:cytochrome c peroxidase